MNGYSGYYDEEEGSCYDEETYGHPEDNSLFHSDCQELGWPGAQGCEDAYFYRGLGNRIKNWWESLFDSGES